jgi:hypothetical protein
MCREDVVHPPDGVDHDGNLDMETVSDNQEEVDEVGDNEQEEDEHKHEVEDEDESEHEHEHEHEHE